MGALQENRGEIMTNKIIKGFTILFIVVNAICGASFLWGFTGEMIEAWHMKYYRDKGLLRGIRIGKKLRYTRQEVLHFLAEQTERTNKSDI